MRDLSLYGLSQEITLNRFVFLVMESLQNIKPEYHFCVLAATEL